MSDIARPLLLVLLAALAASPSPAAAEEAVEPLMDNSFLIEEAYNQEAGVVQQIFTYSRATSGGAWQATFTQEWPAPNQTHQLSYTLAYEDWAPQSGTGRGVGDVLLNYRYQAVANEQVAFAPRLSLVVPTSTAGSGGGAYRGFGLQTNMAVSTTLTPWLVTHANLGGTWVPNGAGGASHVTVALGQSFIWLVTPRFNLMLEALGTSSDHASGGVTTRDQTFTVSPGFRWGIDLPRDVQVVLGLAMPLGVGPSAGNKAVFAYLSVELPFWHPAEEAPAAK